MSRGTFQEIGNLSFYDGWKPNYVYFNSLFKYAHNNSGDTFGTWNSSLARDVALEAIGDAQNHINPNQMDEEESIDYFTQKFEQIISFLEQAVAFERANESAYIQELYDQLQSTFTQKERKEIRALMQLDKLLLKAKESPEVDYDQINVLINVLQQGFGNLRTVINYEEQRITKLDEKLNQLKNRRGNQAAGLKYSMRKDVAEQIEAAERAKERLERKIIVEYATTGQLTRKDHDRYVIFGGASIEKDIPKAIDRVFADWVDQMIEKLSSDKQFVNKIRTKLKDEYPVNGNFKWLEDQTQEDVIQAVIRLGINDLQSVLNKTISDTLVASTKKKLLSNAENSVLNEVQRYKIHGLDTGFGRIIKQPQLIKEAHTLGDMQKNDARELYEAMKRLITAEKGQTNKGGVHARSYLIQAMEGNKNEYGENSLTQTENLISLIEELEKLQEKYEKSRKAYERALKKAKDELTKTPQELRVSKKDSVQLTIVNGELQIEKGSLLDLIKNDNRYASFHFNSFNPQSLKTAIQTLKRKASIQLKQNIIESLQNAKFEIPQRQLVTMVTRELKSVKITINGPTLAELLTGIYFKGDATHAVVDWNKYKGKNDSVQILIASSKSTHKFISGTFYQSFIKDDKVLNFEKRYKDIEEAQERLALEYQKEIDRQVQKLTSDDDMKKYSEMIKIMSTDLENLENADSEVAKAYADLKAQSESLMSDIKKIYAQHSRNNAVIKGVSPEMLEQMYKDFVNTLQRAFYVSTTVKSANDYVNDYGFKGGTLGSKLSSQLARLNDIFSSAGVPIDQDDLDWLESAILNCFPGSVVKEENKSLIESYLGSLAAFALFDEGAVETNIIDNFKLNMAQAIRHNDARRIVHLYVVDGIYVKGSTVLQRVLDSLQGDVMQNIQRIPSLMRKGAGVVIVNRLVENKQLIPNRPWKNHLRNQDTAAWKTVGSRAQEQVSVKILFLAGLLDIIHNINATLNKAEALM